MGIENGGEGTGTALVPSNDARPVPAAGGGDITPPEAGGTATRSTERSASPPARLAEIRALRATNPKLYYSDAIQEEELNLVRTMERGTTAADGDASGLPAELLERWDRQGGRTFHLQQAQTTVRAMLDAMQPDEQEPFMAAFDALPVEVRTPVYDYLAVDGGGWREANTSDIETFKSTAAGAELVAEWGRKAARNVGTIQGRLGMMRRAMGETHWKTAAAFLDSLSPSQEKAVWKALVR